MLVKHFYRIKSSLYFLGGGWKGRTRAKQSKKQLGKKKENISFLFSFFPGRQPCTIYYSHFLKLAISQAHWGWLRYTAEKIHSRKLLFLKQQEQFRACNNHLQLLPWAALLLEVVTFLQCHAFPTDVSVWKSSKEMSLSDTLVHCLKYLWQPQQLGSPFTLEHVRVACPKCWI